MRTYSAVICPGCERLRTDLYFFPSDLHPDYDFLCIKCCDEAIVDFQCQSGCPQCGSDMVLPKEAVVKMKCGTYVKEYSNCRTCKADYFAPYQDIVDNYQRKLIKKRDASKNLHPVK